MWYERKDIRLKGYDYRNIGEYFVTTVTQGRLHLFGRVVNMEMKLSAQGTMVRDAICQIQERFPEVKTLDYVVMPNHIHLLIGKQYGSKPLADIIRWLKIITTRRYSMGVNTQGWRKYDNRLWQRNYYEHIVRNQRAHDYIAQYIYENPQRWAHDKLNSECVNPDHVMRTILSFGQEEAQDNVHDNPHDDVRIRPYTNHKYNQQPLITPTRNEHQASFPSFPSIRRGNDMPAGAGPHLVRHDGL